MSIHVFASATHDFFFNAGQLPAELRPLLKTDGQGIVYITTPHAEFFDAIRSGKPTEDAIKTGINPAAFLPLSHAEPDSDFSTGKGANPAAICGIYGLKPTLHCALGQDPYSEQCIRELTELGVTVVADIIPDETMAHAHIYVQDTDAQLSLIRKAANNHAKVSQRLIDSLDTETTLLCNTSVRLSQTRLVFDEAGKRGVPRIVFNCTKSAGLELNDFRYVTDIVINRDEAQALADHFNFPYDEDSDHELAGVLAQQLKVRCVMTRGSKSVMVAQGQRIDEAIPNPVKVVNVTGAGDGFLGTYLAGIDQGQELLQTVKEAIVVGGLIAAHKGPRRSDISPQLIKVQAAAIMVAPQSYVYGAGAHAKRFSQA